MVVWVGVVMRGKVKVRRVGMGVSGSVDLSTKDVFCEEGG